MALRSQEAAEALDPVVGRGVGEVHPEDVVEDRVVRLADPVHVRDQEHLPAAEAVRDVHVAAAVPVEPEREEREPDVVRRERGHPRPFEVRGQVLVEPAVA